MSLSEKNSDDDEKSVREPGTINRSMSKAHLSMSQYLDRQASVNTIID
jgi:hypothetical protein